MKWLFFKLAFLYPTVYAFFCYYRKKEHRREYAEKVTLLFHNDIGMKRLKRIVRGIFELRGMRKLQRYLIPLIDNRFIQRFVTTEGLDILDRALTEGRGVLLMSAHMGNPHIGFNILRALGYKINVIKTGNPRKPRKFRHVDPPEYTIFTYNAPLASSEKERILEILRSGGILFNLCDGAEGKKMVEASFLGRTMNFPSGIVHFAHQANAIVLPFIHLYRRGKIKLIIKEPIDGDWKQGKKDYKRIMEEFAQLFESYIWAYPEEYLGIYGYTVFDAYYRSSRKSR